LNFTVQFNDEWFRVISYAQHGLTFKETERWQSNDLNQQGQQGNNMSSLEYASDWTIRKEAHHTAEPIKPVAHEVQEAGMIT